MIVQTSTSSDIIPLTLLASSEDELISPVRIKTTHSERFRCASDVTQTCAVALQPDSCAPVLCCADSSLSIIDCTGLVKKATKCKVDNKVLKGFFGGPSARTHGEDGGPACSQAGSEEGRQATRRSAERAREATTVSSSFAKGKSFAKQFVVVIWKSDVTSSWKHACMHVENVESSTCMHPHVCNMTYDM